MNFENITSIERNFRAANINRSIHPADGMAVHHPGDWQKYSMVGVSAVEVVLASLAISPTKAIRSVLDFGCGYGRVARQFRAAFPEAEIHVTDIDRDAIAFCADTFDCIPVQPERNFSKLNLAKNYDLIWVGSVFTHINEDRMRQLLNTFAGSLAPNGIIVATFHGEYVIKVQSKNPIIHPPFWEKIMEQYQAAGIGHHPYGAGRDGGDNWGISLSRPDRIMSLTPMLRCIGYFQKGWANYQDVAVFLNS